MAQGINTTRPFSVPLQIVPPTSVFFPRRGNSFGSHVMSNPILRGGNAICAGTELNLPCLIYRDRVMAPYLLSSCI